MLRRAFDVAIAAVVPIGIACALVLWLGSLKVEAANRDVCASGCAYASIQAALNAANDDDVIRVAAGTYTESLAVVKSLTLRGGYSGPPSWVRDQTKYTSTVLGNNLQSAVAMTSVLVTPISVTLDGFTIRNGRGTPTGGGVRAINVNLTLLNNVIADNALTATNSLTTALGAGVYVEGGALSVSGNTFRKNINSCNGLYCPTNDGGALYVTGTLSATLVNNLFDANYSWRGAAFATFNTPVYAAGNTFENNNGAYGPGLYAEGNGVLVIERNLFAGNNSGDRATLNLYQVGGLILSSNVLTGNYGYYGSIMAVYGSGQPLSLTNNMLINNRGSRYASGLIVSSADAVFVNNTFANYTSPSQTVPFLYLVGGSYTLVNNIFFSLTTAISLPINTDSAWLSHNAFDGNSLDWAGTGIVLGTGNLTGTNPLFVNAPRDYHLRADSPLRRQGDGGYNPGVDFEGDPRFAPPDIGADQFVNRVLLPLATK